MRINSNNSKSSKNVQNKRAFRKVRSRLKKRLRSGAQLEKAILAKYHLRKYRSRRYTPKSKLELVNQLLDGEFPLHKVEVPEVFCFLRAPEKTSKFLFELNKKMSSQTVRNINVIHENTFEIGLSASWLFDECIKSAKERWMKEDKKLFLRGTTSRHRAVNNFLMAFGFLKEMKINPRQLTNVFDFDYEKKFKHFRMSGSKQISYRKGNASTALVDYFNTCLGFIHKELTIPGRTKLVDAFGEIIGNSEEHGGIDVEWQVLGCFEKESSYVNFAILNKGYSIFETLSDQTSTSKSVLEKIEKVILDHRNFLKKTTDFLFKDDQWVQTIWNVMALQEGISSKRTNDSEGNTRGQGMMDVLEFIAEIRETSNDAQVAIISGNSYILVDYEVSTTFSGADGIS